MPGRRLAPWNVSAAITVPAGGSSGALIPLIPEQSFASLVPPGSSTLNLVLNVRGHGVLGSQDGFTTAWFQVPVQVCAGCLDANFCPAGESFAGFLPSGRSRGHLSRPERVDPLRGHSAVANGRAVSSGPIPRRAPP